MERYYRDVMAGDDARWTPPAAHDAAVVSLPGTVEAVALSADVDTLRVVDRTGETLFRSEGPASRERVEGAVRALHEGMSRPLSPQEARRYERSVEQMRSAHERFTASDPEARAAWTQIITHDLPLVRGRTAQAVAEAARPARGEVTPRRNGPAVGERSYRQRTDRPRRGPGGLSR